MTNSSNSQYQVSRRKGARYKINNSEKSPHFIISIDEIHIFHVIDFSIRGALLKKSNKSNEFPSLEGAKVELIAFRKKIPVAITKVDKRKSNWVVEFDQKSDSFVLQISEIINLLKFGHSCTEVIRDTPSSTQMNNRRRYMGDGPTEIVIDRKHETPEFMLGMVTYRLGENYWSVLWNQGLVSTKKTIDQDGVGARMEQTVLVNYQAVQQVAITCSATKFQDCWEMSEKLGSWLNENEPHEAK